MRVSLLLLFLGAVALIAAPKPSPPKAYTNPASTDDDFIIQGEYVGEVEGKRFGVQVIALGGNQFEAVAYHGGLPGDGWDGDRSTLKRTQGSRNPGDTTVLFKTDEYIGEVDGNMLYASNPEGKILLELQRVSRESPTLHLPPPPGAIVLFDGKTKINQFPGSQVTEDGLLMEGATSADKYADFSLHLEFRLPYMPAARGQARGNSGIYLQGRYEVQMLDSFGLEGKDNECGGIYQVAPPKANLCFPPLTWQTYDIDFTAAKFDTNGKKTTNARLTVKHNGMLIHETQEIPALTPASPVKDETTAPGPIFLQNHGNPVRYRNIWLLPK